MGEIAPSGIPHASFWYLPEEYIRHSNGHKTSKLGTKLVDIRSVYLDWNRYIQPARARLDGWVGGVPSGPLWTHKHSLRKDSPPEIKLRRRA